MAEQASLFVGDPAPWFRQRCTTTAGYYSFDTTGGRYVLLYFFRSSQDAVTAGELRAVRSRRRIFDDHQASFFGVSAEPSDETGLLEGDLPGIRYFFDSDGLVGRLYGVAPAGTGAGVTVEPRWFLLDPLLRVRATFSDQPGMSGRMLDLLERLMALEQSQSEPPVPVLILPDVFEPEFCQRLIGYFDRAEPQLSGVFTEATDGVSQTVTDPRFKRRRDCQVRDRQLVAQIQARIVRRVVPEVRKVFQFDATRLERLILASYDAVDQGRFGPHRDNTVSATRHRRFAVSINLNQDFEGGELVFPEFSRRTYKPAAGGALVFSCSLMHLVTPVRAGRRVACLPFVHDEEAAKQRVAQDPGVAPTPVA